MYKHWSVTVINVYIHHNHILLSSAHPDSKIPTRTVHSNAHSRTHFNVSVIYLDTLRTTRLRHASFSTVFVFTGWFTKVSHILFLHRRCMKQKSHVLFSLNCSTFYGIFRPVYQFFTSHVTMEQITKWQTLTVLRRGQLNHSSKDSRTFCNERCSDRNAINRLCEQYV